MNRTVQAREFSRVVFFTGAGMSAESGVPTYRGRGGVWAKYNYEDYACQEAFERDPEKVWDFHDQRRAMIGACEPNQGHRLIAAFQRDHPGTVVVTQNVDGLHQRAGTRIIFELHGSLWRLRCDPCRVLEDNREAPLANRRHACGAPWRPDIVWFGDALVPEVVRGALDAIQGCDLLVSIGTSAVVFPAAEFPIHAKRAGATLVEINPEETPLSGLFDLCIRRPASEGLREILGASP